MSVERAVAWFREAFPSSIWSIIRWIAFFFKLISLAFAVPIIGLIVFDFCLWLWRLYRPSLPESSLASRPPKERTQELPDPPTSTKASSSAIDIETKLPDSERRTTYAIPIDHR
ncbi:hypothetical protein F5Y19DRAFT_469585 [Xylariaceae sp. FL1651]|nr:hypothetical protein F5Y19DRAFT_469585 [Xylariaceae sp. FL1651]